MIFLSLSYCTLYFYMKQYIEATPFVLLGQMCVCVIERECIVLYIYEEHSSLKNVYAFL